MTSKLPAGTEIYLAILEVQKKVGVLKKDAQNPFFKSSYLSLSGLLEALQPVLTDNGLVVMQHPKIEGELTTQIIHAQTGQIIESTMVLPLGDKQTPQSIGSAISYARRYSLQAIFNIASEDDDGQQTSTQAMSGLAFSTPVYGGAKCLICSSPATRKEGVKNNKPWAGTFCSADKSHVQWEKQNQPQSQPLTLNLPTIDSDLPIEQIQF